MTAKNNKQEIMHKSSLYKVGDEVVFTLNGITKRRRYFYC